MLHGGEVRTVTDDVEETNENGQLKKCRKTRLKGIDFHLLPEKHRFLLHFGGVVGIFLLESVHARLELLELALALQCMLVRDEQKQLNEDRQNDDGKPEVMPRNP